MADATPDTLTPVRRDPRLIPLSHDHQIALGRAREIVLALDGTIPQALPQLAAACVYFADAELLPHFEREERLLVPPFAARVGEEDVDLVAMLDQHGALRTLTDALRGDSDTALADRLEAWSKALTAHIRFEERTVFKRMQASFSEPELAAIGAELDGQGPTCSL